MLPLDIDPGIQLPFEFDCGRIESHLNQVGDCQVKVKSVSRVRFISGMVVLGLLLATIPFGVQAQTQDVRYFPETGHNVHGEFLEFFDQHGGLKIFGYPLTEEFTLDSRTVQYFQRARFELHPENEAPYRVQLGLLGQELGKQTPSVARSDNSFFQRYFPETGHNVAFAFLNFFDANGGFDNFGYPITEFVAENSRIVQYFQRAKFEWYPELAPAQRVQLGDLGSVQFDTLAAQGRVSPNLKQPAPPAIPGATAPLALKVTATPKYTVASRRSPQTIYVFVTDQKNSPLSGANVRITVRDGTNVYVRDVMPATNNQGFASYTFDVSQLRTGKNVIVEIMAELPGLSDTTQTSFFTWF